MIGDSIEALNSSLPKSLEKNNLYILKLKILPKTVIMVVILWLY